MMIIQNPLAIYKAWLVERNVDWADTIASSFFDSLRLMCETRKLSNVSKKEYENGCKVREAYFNANSNNKPQAFRLDWEEGEYDYGDDKGL